MNLYDLHVHTSEVSPCGHLNVQEMVSRYEEKGYSGIWLTNHFHREFEEMTRGMCWKEKAEFFLEPYRKGKELGGSRLLVGLGMEIRFYEDPNDYLLYGMTEELLCREGERWLEMNLKSFYAAYGNRLLIIQAHPNREGSSAPAPVQLLHGMEAVNTSPRHENGNEKTQHILAVHPWLIPTGGSDSHREEDVGRGGLETEQPLQSEGQLIDLLRSRNYRIIDDACVSAGGCLRPAQSMKRGEPA